jgi:acetyl-CoA acetyltransferase
MREVAIVAFAQTKFVAQDLARDEVEMIREVVMRTLSDTAVDRRSIGFFCSGSCDYVQGVPFSFVGALDALGAFPPIMESHVEMDGAFALYEAYVRLQHGDIDSALVYAFGKPSLGDMADVFSQQLDPYTMSPLWADPDSVAALQARAVLDAKLATEADFARIAARNLSAAHDNPFAHHGRPVSAEALLELAYHRAPLRPSDVAPTSDGAACAILMTRDRALELSRKLGHEVAFIRGIDHRIEPMQLGLRKLERSASTRLAAQRAGAAGQAIDIAELSARYSHEEIVLREALDLSEQVTINPSGGCFGANAPMVAGLVRIGEVASRIFRGEARRGVAHATSGPCLQQNLVCVLEGA